MNRQLTRSLICASLGLLLSCSATYGQPAGKSNIVYQVFVRSFCDSNQDNIGDLQGLRQRLDYLNDGRPGQGNDLEVGILYVMPIFPAGSYHGYDVTDYQSINKEYGTMQDFADLINEAHRRGMRVILDVAFNHTSDRHPWFLDALADRNGKRGWYQMWPDDGHVCSGWHTATDAAGNRLKYFGFDTNMPDLNLDNPEVRKAVKDIAAFWLAQGVDGFRLDAAKHIYCWGSGPMEGEIQLNNAWWREFSTYVYGRNRDAIVVGEVLGDTGLLVRHARGLNMLIDEPFMNAIRGYVMHKEVGILGQWQKFLKDADAENGSEPYDSFVYLSSHDRNPRLASDLESLGSQTDEAYRLALCILMTASRYPVIYMGDEVMQRGWKWNGGQAAGGDGSKVWDETLREPLPWNTNNDDPGQTHWQPAGQNGFLPKFDRPADGVSVEEQAVQGGTLNLLRGLCALRSKCAPLNEGKLGLVHADTADWLVFERTAGNETVLVLINASAQGHDYDFHENWLGDYRAGTLLFWADGQQHKWEDRTEQPPTVGTSVYVPPYGVVILKQKTGH